MGQKKAAVCGLFLRELHFASRRLRPPWGAADSTQARSVRSVLPDAHVAGKNRLHFVRGCGREFSEGFRYQKKAAIWRLLIKQY